MQTKNNRWLKYLLFFAIIGVVVSIFIKLATPEEVVIPKTDFISQNKEGLTTDFSEVVFVGAIDLDIPSQLHLISFELNPTASSYIRDQLIEKYELKQSPNSRNIWVGLNHSLFYNKQEDDFSFSYRVQTPLEVNNDLKGSISLAESFVSETFPDIVVEVIEDQISFIQAFGHSIGVDRAEANIIEIPFSHSVDGIPAFIDHRPRSVISIKVNSKLEIQKVVFQPIFFDLVKSNSLKTISLESALENINNGEAVIISSSYEEGTPFSKDEIVSGELTEVSLEYRLDLENAIGYPFYRFKGDLINTEGKTISAEIITPAVLVK